jgi:DNA polymerase-3 subunit delta'
MSLKEIFCQDKAIGILQRAFAADRCAHAYIFAGLDGVGKSKTAWAWAKLLLCAEPLMQNGFADSCGFCESCRLLEAGTHPDFNYIYKELIEFTKEGKNKSAPVDLPIDVIREFLIEKAPTKPILSDRKVFVVSEAEKLNTASQNALLKVLEEPPHYCTIILLCTRMEKLLPTIRSRCQTIRFGPIDSDIIIENLKGAGLEHGKAQFFARLAQGSLGTACQWAQLELTGADLYKAKKNVLTTIADCELADVVMLAQQFLEECRAITAAWASIDKAISKTDLNRRAQKTLIHIIISALHDAMVLNVMPEKTLINSDQKEQIKQLMDSFSSEQAADKIVDCYEKLRWVEANVNERLIFEHLLLKFAGSAIISA